MEDTIEGIGNGRVIIQRDFDQLETKLQEAHLDCYSETAHRGYPVRQSLLDMKSLLDMIHELKNHKGGPPDY
ncbi:hypothetical protein Tco_1183288 [Tanacetum coccineum]